MIVNAHSYLINAMIFLILFFNSFGLHEWFFFVFSCSQKNYLEHGMLLNSEAQINCSCKIIYHSACLFYSTCIFIINFFVIIFLNQITRLFLRKHQLLLFICMGLTASAHNIVYNHV